MCKLGLNPAGGMPEVCDTENLSHVLPLVIQFTILPPPRHHHQLEPTSVAQMLSQQVSHNKSTS